MRIRRARFKTLWTQRWMDTLVAYWIDLPGTRWRTALRITAERLARALEAHAGPGGIVLRALCHLLRVAHGWIAAMIRRINRRASASAPPGASERDHGLPVFRPDTACGYALASLSASLSHVYQG